MRGRLELEAWSGYHRPASHWRYPGSAWAPQSRAGSPLGRWGTCSRRSSWSGPWLLPSSLEPPSLSAGSAGS